jgi:hypothetical protein
VEPNTASPILKWSEAGPHVYRTLDLRQFWSLPETGPAQYREWQYSPAKRTFEARTCCFVDENGKLCSEKPRTSYNEYDFEQLKKLCAREDRHIPKWILALIRLRRQQVMLLAECITEAKKLKLPKVSRNHQATCKTSLKRTRVVCIDRHQHDVRDGSPRSDQRNHQSEVR